LFNHVVAAHCGDHLLVIDMGETRYRSDCGSVTPQLIGTDRVWNKIFGQEPIEEQFGSLSITMSLEQDIEHEAVLVYCPP
jgi:hypothetical protein